MKCSLVKQHSRKPKKMKRDEEKEAKKLERLKINLGIWEKGNDQDNPRSSSER